MDIDAMKPGFDFVNQLERTGLRNAM